MQTVFYIFQKCYKLKASVLQYIIKCIINTYIIKYWPEIGNKNFALQKPFETDFLTVIGNAKLWPSFVICWVAQGSRLRCGPRHPISHSNIFVYVKLLATIFLSWNIIFSCHPTLQKIGIIYMLVDRALKLSHPKHHKENLQLIRNTLHL